MTEIAAAGFRKRLRKSVLDWAVRRSPRSRQLTLKQKRIYIMPSAAGFGFLLLLGIILLLAINYQNNLAYGVVFLLLSLFIITIIHTYANMSGLTISFVRGHHCFVGDDAAFELQLNAAAGRQYHSLQLSWQDGAETALDLVDGNDESVTLYLPARQRGVLPAGVLLIQTYYPLGLIKAWSWLDADLQVLVYPQPIAGGSLLETASGRGDGRESGQSGAQEFAGLEQFQQGMSPRHIAWKQYARGQGLLAKQYVDYAEKNCWLSWQLWPELGTEARLSRLTWWTLQLEKQGAFYGLILPGTEIEPGRGELHRNRILQALALFPHGQSGDPQ
ncbi:DUF58 domain-containing protein [Amphritea sp. HPY]|uniref:DUF58 domain-containing protein n=1 Tax=Amphritea sp. HPY TaxID=3421652 RepID=UPI003D7CF848